MVREGAPGPRLFCRGAIHWGCGTIHWGFGVVWTLEKLEWVPPIVWPIRLVFGEGGARDLVPCCMHYVWVHRGWGFTK